jgi:hypothetical protein
MKGLDIAEQYYLTVGKPLIENKYSDYKDRIAVGLVGDGSDCLGFDDEISRDHDWGPGFCMWLGKDDFNAIGASLAEDYAGLVKSFEGYERIDSDLGQGRTGVFEIGDFYRRQIGCPNGPENDVHWLKIPEKFLAASVSGRVFHDPLGEFSRIRDKIRSYYPEDIRLARLAAQCLKAGQCGQYNWSRSRRRNDRFAMKHAEVQFLKAAMSIVYLVNRRYAPYYKWMHRGLLDLDTLGSVFFGLVEELLKNDDPTAKSAGIQEICDALVAMLGMEGASQSASRDLLDQADEIKIRISSDKIRALNLWALQ